MHYNTVITYLTVANLSIADTFYILHVGFWAGLTSWYKSLKRGVKKTVGESRSVRVRAVTFHLKLKLPHLVWKKTSDLTMAIADSVALSVNWPTVVLFINTK